MNDRIQRILKVSHTVRGGMSDALPTDIRVVCTPLLDYLSSTFAYTLMWKRPFVIISPRKLGVTLLPLPTGRNFSKKSFTFIAHDSKLAHFSLDSSLYCIV
jgi:hypothetical protein